VGADRVEVVGRQPLVGLLPVERQGQFVPGPTSVEDVVPKPSFDAEDAVADGRGIVADSKERTSKVELAEGPVSEEEPDEEDDALEGAGGSRCEDGAEVAGPVLEAGVVGEDMAGDGLGPAAGGDDELGQGMVVQRPLEDLEGWDRAPVPPAVLVLVRRGQRKVSTASSMSSRVAKEMSSPLAL
jgi:hypothetical protein